MFNKEKELWITNISMKKDIVISDLGITIRKGSNINLLAKKKNGLSKYPISVEQIDASIESGSIKNNENLRVRKVAPIIFSNRLDVVENQNLKIQSKFSRKKTEIEFQEYPDLEFDIESDEEVANKLADIEIADTKEYIEEKYKQ
jgi:hypothetical protein